MDAQTTPQGTASIRSETEDDKSENSDPYDSHDSDDDEDYDILEVPKDGDLTLQSQLSSIGEE